MSHPPQLVREKSRDAEEQKDSKLEVKLRQLQDKGLVRLEKTASGSLDIEVIPVTVVQAVAVSVTETGINQITDSLYFPLFYVLYKCIIYIYIFFHLFVRDLLFYPKPA